MFGDISREEKIAAARKKLKQFQKKKEADKLKNSGSRQSTPDTPVELVSCGKEVPKNVDQIVSNISEVIVNNDIPLESLPNTDIEEESKHETNEDVVINPNQFQPEVIDNLPEINNQFEVSSVNEMIKDGSKITENEIEATSVDTINSHSNIQNYFNTENNQAENVFEDITPIQKDENLHTFFNPQTTPVMNEQQQSNYDLALLDVSNHKREVRSSTSTNDCDIEVHTQTISILVAEKSELQSQLQETVLNLDKRNAEVLDLCGKLKSSENQVNLINESNSYLNRELDSLNQYVDKANNDRCNLTTQLDKYKAQYEDVKSMNDELNLRMIQEFEHKEQISEELVTAKSKLELANIHVQQLRDSSNEDLSIELNTWKNAVIESKKQIESLNSALKQSEVNKASREYEYNSYGNHLLAQLEAAYDKIRQIEFKLKEVMRTNTDLEVKLQLLLTEEEVGGRLTIQKYESLNKLCEDLSNENNSMKKKLSALEMDNKSLSKMCVEQRESLEEMEASIERKNSMDVDTTQLLQAMQSDKVAASRALSQNRQLKEQLEELQNGFIMMSNKKLELTEKLEVENHFKKSLQKELAEVKEQISMYSELLARKADVSVADDYQLTPELEPEVAASDDGLNSVASDISFLMDASTQVDIIDGNIEQACDCLDEDLNSKLKEAEEVMVAGERPVADVGDVNSNFIRKDIYLALEKRFTTCMRDLATAQDDKQCLDHVVQRLQHETELVGDYITIYQFQRGVMKKDVEELTCELTQLKTEREKMRSRLASLQNLVSRLTGEIHHVETPNAENHFEVIEEENSIVQEKTQIVQQDFNDKNKRQTVNKIIKLISDMESSSQLDVSVLNKFHPCPLCSGKLINV